MDAKSLYPIQELIGHTHHIVDCSFSPNGKRIITVSSDESARIWHNRRPEYWYGIAWLWESWAVFLFSIALVISVWLDTARSQKYMNGS